MCASTIFYRISIGFLTQSSHALRKFCVVLFEHCRRLLVRQGNRCDGFGSGSIAGQTTAIDATCAEGDNFVRLLRQLVNPFLEIGHLVAYPLFFLSKTICFFGVSIFNPLNLVEDPSKELSVILKLFVQSMQLGTPIMSASK